MAKRTRSVKQKANDRRLGAMAKARGRKSHTTKRRTVRKTIKRTVRRVRTVARRRTTHTRRRSSTRGKVSGIINKIPLLKNKTVQRIGFGLGMGSIAGLIAGMIPIPMIQSNAPLIKTGVTFATDPLAGVVSLALGGGLGQLTSLLGGGSSATQSSGGFA